MNSTISETFGAISCCAHVATIHDVRDDGVEGERTALSHHSLIFGELCEWRMNVNLPHIRSRKQPTRQGASTSATVNHMIRHGVRHTFAVEQPEQKQVSKLSSQHAKVVVEQSLLYGTE